MSADERTSPVENDYLLAASYRFARRFVKGKSVADIRLGGSGYGANLLAENAASVATITSVRAEDISRNEGRFDVAVAFGGIEYAEELVAGAKRLLKEGGVLVVSAADRQTFANERNRGGASGGMYVPEFREMLERSFGNVKVYRLGVVSGAVVLPEEGSVEAASVEGADFHSAEPSFGDDVPRTWFVLAVCGDGVSEEGDGLFVFDREARVFDEYEEARGEARLLRDEISHIQRTEVQAFRNAVRVAASDRILTEVARRLGVSSDVYRPAIRLAMPLIQTLSLIYRGTRELARRLRGSSDG